MFALTPKQVTEKGKIPKKIYKGDYIVNINKMEKQKLIRQPKIMIKNDGGITSLEFEIPEKLEKEIEKEVLHLSGTIVTI